LSQSQKVSEAFRQFLLEAVALVALGTVADVVPLLGENRVFVRHGLRSLQAQPSVGLRALLAAAKLDLGQPLDAEHIAFHLAPRLNAAGRLGSARLAIELLATPSPQRAEDLARYLNAQNEQRQTVERRIFNAAKDQIAALGALDELPALVLADPQWHAGVIGIVAGRLVERYARPVLLVASREEPSQGSGRSIEGFPLHEALAACSQYLLSHGGHALAAGFKLRPGAFEAFRDAFQAHARQRLQHSLRQHTLRIDAEIPLAAVSGSLLKLIDLLEPYGQGNPRPRFLASGLRLVGTPRKVGSGERHLTFQVTQEGSRPVRAVAFGMADRYDEILVGGGACSLVFTPRLSQWNGVSRIDLQVIDFQPRDRPELV
jgi:single-stranded-DNA-specific exonuclease